MKHYSCLLCAAPTGAEAQEQQRKQAGAYHNEAIMSACCVLPPQAAKAQEQQLNGQRKRAEAYRAEADALNEQLSALQ
eukprot:scaffold54065_cov16-Tisochrysis_lutea.AAC.1